MKILGIETSCDETALSILDINDMTRTVRVLGNVVHSQIDVHAPYGGVFPILAKREHQRNLIPVLERVLEHIGNTVRSEALALPESACEPLSRETELLELFKERMPHIQKPDIDAISVTVGPGLEPALWVGINFARALGILWNVPVIPCNHMEGHILAALIRHTTTDTQSFNFIDQKIVYPALSLLISGGHTQIILIEKIGSYTIIGETLDDAVGECFDKVARMLGLEYPGGPKISRLAAEACAKNIHSPEPLPRPMIDSKNLNFSFSGLKTAVLYLTHRIPKMNDDIRMGICREVEDAVVDVLVSKMRTAIERHAVGTLIIGGGVIANTRIREALETLATDCSIDILLPQTNHATDNGLMIALAGYVTKDRAVSAEKNIKAQGTLALGLRNS